MPHVFTGTANSDTLRARVGKWSLRSCGPIALILCTLGYIAYVAFGGLLFMILEGKEEVSVLRKLHEAKVTIIRKYPNVTGDVLDEFLSELSSIGISGLQVVNATEPKWSYSQAVVFSVTLLTTIGYGHITPGSQFGKAACIFYTALGIPFTLIILGAYVYRFGLLADYLQGLMFSRLDKVLKPISIRMIFLGLATVTVGVLFFFLPAIAFNLLEDKWTYLDAIYFCFISLTTVGLGDFVPGRYAVMEHTGLYRFGVICYLFGGVAALMFLMGLLTDFQECIITRQEKVKRAPLGSKPPSYGSIVLPDRIMLLSDAPVDITREYG